MSLYFSSDLHAKHTNYPHALQIISEFFLREDSRYSAMKLQYLILIIISTVKNFRFRLLETPAKLSTKINEIRHLNLHLRTTFLGNSIEKGNFSKEY